VLGGAIITLFFAAKKNKQRQLDERISFKKRDKIPYGCWVAYETLPGMFPEAEVSANRYEPGYWEELSNYEEDQVLVIVAPRLEATRDEMLQIARFADKGNHVLISTAALSSEAETFFNLRARSDGYYLDGQDGMKISIDPPGPASASIYGYPGRGFHGHLSQYDESITEVLGRSEKKEQPNLVRLKAGKGWIYLHLEPMAFTNYFLLHKQNIRYFETLFSMMPATARKVVWDEYYISQKPSTPPREKKSWFTVLMNMENEEGRRSFRAAFWVLIGLLLVYVFVEMRRKQRIIPILSRPRNDSLDFVRTIGRLYYDKGDHRNLARKMSAFFMDHVRNKYKISTSLNDTELAEALAAKTGMPSQQLNNLVGMIRYAEASPEISGQWLMEFHNELESFYLNA
jgi:hypothetical protein